MRTLKAGLHVLVAGLPLLVASPAVAQKLDQAIEQDAEINRESRRSQQRIDTISDDTQTLLEEYRLTQKRIRTTSRCDSVGWGSRCGRCSLPATPARRSSVGWLC